MSEELDSLIKKAVKKAGNITQLAIVLGVERSTVSRWINKTHYPSAKHIVHLQRFLKENKK